MGKDLTDIPEMPIELHRRMECKMLHSQVPFRTGQKVWLERTQEYVDEIIWICKEGCGRPKSSVRMAHEAAIEENKLRMKHIEQLENGQKKDS